MREEEAAARIAVVGHTNTGKTSLLRTLTRDRGFGEVSSRPSTTRHVEGVQLSADGEVVVTLYDTPGLEDPMGLLDELDRIAPQQDAAGRHDGPARLARFLESPAAQGRFEQEAKVVRQLLASDAGLYVIDARDPVLAKFRDELALLAMCGKPILPVFNFVAEQVDVRPWREALARLGLHVAVRFDTVVPGREGERTLYQQLGTLLEAHKPAFERLIAARQREAEARRQAALWLVAELLVDVAAYRVRLAGHDEDQVVQAVEDVHQRVRMHEQRCVAALVQLYRFDREDVEDAELPLTEGRWDDDLFNPETLRQAGIDIGSGAAAGAAAGMGVDLLVGGLTLGAAAAIGALAGGGWQALRHFGERLQARLTRVQTLTVSDSILTLLAVRQLYLVSALEVRGHAALTPIQQYAVQESERVAGLMRDSVRIARAHAEWSAVAGGAEDGSERRETIERLADQLAQA